MNIKYSIAEYSTRDNLIWLSLICSDFLVHFPNLNGEHWRRKSFESINPNGKTKYTSAQKLRRSRWDFRNTKKKDLYPLGFKPGILYRIAKIHKVIVSKDEVASFRAILSAVTTTLYNIAKFYDQVVKPTQSMIKQ